MSWSYDPSSWTGATKPTVSDFQHIATDLHTRGATVDGGAYGRANTGFMTLVSGDLPGTLYTVTGASWASSVASLTIGSHNIKVGQIVQVSSIVPSGYNGTVLVTAVTGTTISYALASNPGAYISGGSVLVSAGAAADGMLAVDQNGNLNFRKSGAFGVVLTGATTAWTSLTLLNSWVNFGGAFNTAQYMIDPLGFVHLRGTIKNGTITNGTILFTLPIGFRPPATVQLLMSGGLVAGDKYLIVIDSSGNAECFGLGGNSFVDLTGIAFSIAT